mmetsp:Transcript_6548/g.10247  ORF Transcript_6548/g.10247 Transcript_6548/m.10247 type:complete len:138 (-) Transcript_6548:157-570(-)
MQRHDGHSSAHEMMKDIPSGVWQLVMNYLSSRDLCKNLAPVCKRFRTESERNDQWRPRVLARWQFVTEDFVLRSKETKVAVWKATFVQLSSQVNTIFAQVRNEACQMMSKVQRERIKQEENLRLKLWLRRQRRNAQR